MQGLRGCVSPDQWALHPDAALALQVSEVALVRDVLYVCQGIDGKYIRYNLAAAGGLGAYALEPAIGLPAAEQQQLLQLCELGWLFRFAKS